MFNFLEIIDKVVNGSDIVDVDSDALDFLVLCRAERETWNSVSQTNWQGKKEGCLVIMKHAVMLCNTIIIMNATAQPHCIDCLSFVWILHFY